MSQRFSVGPSWIFAFLLAGAWACGDDGSGGSGNSTATQSGGGGSDTGGAPLGGGGSGGNGGGAPPNTGGAGGGEVGGMAAGGMAEGGMGQGGMGQGGMGQGGMAQGGAGGEGEGGGPVVDPELYLPETENNGSLVNADPLTDGALGFQAELSSSNDVDIFSIVAPLGSSLRAAVSDGMGGCPPNANLTLQVYAPDNLTVLGTTSGRCPVLDGNQAAALGSVTQAGTHFVRVAGVASVPLYVLELSATPPECGDGIPQLGEQCDDGNMTEGDGCENDCTETEICGNGSIQGNEACDDGNQNDNDACSNSCQLISCSAGQTLVTHTAMGLPLNIVDESTVSSTINVPETGTITKLVVSVDITHTYDGDLVLSLDPPAAPVLNLAANNGASGDNYRNTVFSSQASTPITSANPPFTGVFLPEAGSFSSVLNTAANGSWVLSITDTAGSDVGTLHRYSLSMCVTP